MLSESGINPFESQETKPYKDDPRILVMMQLVNAFQKSDIDEFNRLVHSHEREIMSDKFVRIFFDDLMLSVRSQGIINIVKSYTRISLVHLSSLLSLDVESVEIILMKLILDRRLVNSKIDMINGILEVDYNSYTVNDEPQIKMTSILPERYRDSELDQIRQQEQHTIASGEVTDIAPQIVQRSNALLSWMDISSTLHSSLANNTRNG